MINLVVKSNSNIEDLFDINIEEKFNFFLKRKLLGSNNIAALFGESHQFSNQTLTISDFVLCNNFIETSSDEHLIRIVYSHSKEIHIDNILEYIKNQLKETKIIPSIIDIELVDDENGDVVPSLTFEYIISKEYISWLYNDTSLSYIVKAQFQTIENFESSIKVNKKSSFSNIQADIFNKTPSENIEIMKELIKKHIKDTGIPISLALAQFCVETGFGKSELCKQANNCFGIKTLIPYHKWFGSTWDETTVYNIETTEFTTSGKIYKERFNFRKYNNIEESIVDYISYLLNTTNGMKLRYEGINKCKDYKEAVRIVVNGHYSTNQEYEKLLIEMIEKRKFMKLDEEVK